MTSQSRVVLVTGASAGFGRSICTRLAAAGYRVYGTSRREQPGGGPFSFVAMDVDRDESVEAAIAEVVSREGRLDAVVGNAGWGIAGALEDTSSDEALAQFQTNFFGNHRLVRAALPHLRKQNAAHIVIIGSLAGLIGTPFQGMYAASKFALEGYCEALRLELRNVPVRVAILEPGDFATGFTTARIKAAASGTGSLYEAAFARALAVMEEEERTGGDPALVSAAVEEVLANPQPPLRRVVVGPRQEGFENLRRHLSDEDIEAKLAEIFID